MERAAARMAALRFRGGAANYNAGSFGLRQQLLCNFSVHVGEPEVPPLKAVGQLRMIEAKEMKDRCVQVMDVDFVFSGVEAELVGFAESEAGFHAAAGQPHREAIRMMIASVVAPALN